MFWQKVEMTVKAAPTPEVRDQSTTARRGLVVLGMHRSGTSALARCLNLLGATLPRNLMGANQYNEKGHWESLDLYRIHDALLATCESSWDDWSPVAASWFSAPEMKDYARQISEVLVRDFPDDPLFVVKDPRICRLIPLWRRIFADIGVDFVPVIPLRHPLEVAASLNRRDGFGVAKGCLLWLRHVLEAEANTRDLRRSVLEYKDLLGDWRGVTQEIARRLSITWPQPAETAADDIDRFLSADQRSHVSNVADLARRSDVVGWVATTYESMRSLARNGENPLAHARLDSVRTSLDSACQAFAPLILDLQSGFSVQTKALRKEARERAAELAERSRQLETQSGELRAARTLQEQNAAALREKSARLVTLTSDAAVAAARIEALSAEVDRLHQALKDEASRVVELESSGIWKEGGFGRSGIAGVTRSVRRRVQHRYLPGEFRKQQVYRAIARSGLFDRSYYLARNPDVREADIDALDHYLRSGEGEGRKPHRLFDPAWYFRQYPDVAESKLNALYHYVRFGAMHGRLPNPWFDSAQYLKEHEDVAAAGMNPLLHYATRGYKEGSRPRPDFDASWYRGHHPSLADPNADPLAFHMEIGARIGLAISPGAASPVPEVLPSSP